MVSSSATESVKRLFEGAIAGGGRENKRTHRHSYDGVVEELREVGLNDVADTVQAAAESFRHEWASEPPFPHDCTCLIEGWKQEMAKKAEYEASLVSS
jgi:hypothetical protein